MNSVVVKLGGHALDSLAPSSAVLVALAQDVASLTREGSAVAIVHGGGPQIQALLDSVGRESHFLEGLRVTDAETMEYVAMGLSQVNLHLVAAFNAGGLSSVGLSGADNSTFRSTALGEPWGRAGASPHVDVDLIHLLWRHGLTPVMSPLAVDEGGELVNCNADSAAGALAGALDATALVLLSDVDQLRRDALDDSSSLTRVTGEEVRHLIDVGAVRDGMRPKMVAALDALDGGARRVLVANGTTPHALRDVLSGAVPKTEVVS
ncbi:MAG: argB [Acidimicrobiaceae bacterium]|nr:argB [Acidimicrobiaceae bacterium]